MVIYCREKNMIGNMAQNQLYFMEDGHKYWPYGCVFCGDHLCDFGDFEGNEDHIVITAEIIDRIRKGLL